MVQGIWSFDIRNSLVQNGKDLIQVVDYKALATYDMTPNIPVLILTHSQLNVTSGVTYNMTPAAPPPPEPPLPTSITPFGNSVLQWSLGDFVVGGGSTWGYLTFQTPHCFVSLIIRFNSGIYFGIGRNLVYMTYTGSTKPAPTFDLFNGEKVPPGYKIPTSDPATGFTFPESDVFYKIMVSTVVGSPGGNGLAITVNIQDP